MIHIVTDSASDIPSAWVSALGIRVVPVYVNFGAKSYLDGIDLTQEAFYAKMAQGQYPTTAAPSEGMFAEVYRQCARDGATAVISIHLADTLSSTCNSARMGANAVADTIPVTVIDSQQLSLGSGFLSVIAAQAARSGQSVETILALLAQVIPKTVVFGMINQLEALRQGGRVNWATFGLGTLLRIKPILQIQQGVVDLFAKVRTQKRALSHLVEIIEQEAPFTHLAVLHVNAQETAVSLQKQTAHLLPQGQEPLLVAVSPALGTHLGLDAVGFATIKK